MSASRLRDCPTELSKKTKLKNSGKVFVFLREQRYRIFDELMQQKLLPIIPQANPLCQRQCLSLIRCCYKQKSDAVAALEATVDVVGGWSSGATGDCQTMNLHQQR